MTAYYNENDADKAAWLRELIKAGLIAPGEPELSRWLMGLPRAFCDCAVTAMASRRRSRKSS